MVEEKTKILIIRFSSFGDVTQCLSVPSKLKEFFASAELHWITREDMAPLLVGHPSIDKVMTLPRKSSWASLLQMISQLQKERYTYIYDAHNNLRSHLISLFLRPPIALTRLLSPPLFLRKSQKRWRRFLLFKLHLNTYRQPFSGQRDLLEPLAEWGVSESLPRAPQIMIQSIAENRIKTELLPASWTSFVSIAPSAAFALKRWPITHWQELIRLHPDLKFVILGGPEDTFLQQLVAVAPDRVLNLAGLLSLQESVAAISLSRALVSNDTGLLHVGEQLGKPTIALMGPAPFGFPSRQSTTILELKLSCRPCSKHGQGPCTNNKFQCCLVDITPQTVSRTLRDLLHV